MDDHFLLADFIHDQIVAERQAAESRLAGCLADVGPFGDPPCRVLDACDETRCGLAVVLRNVCEYGLEIGNGTAFVSQPHAPR